MAHVAVVVGHHPDAQGATSIGGVTEYAYNTIVAKHLALKLEARGYRVSRPERPGPRALTKLAALIRKSGANLCLELHFNAASPTGHGSEMLYWHAQPESKALARSVQEAVVAHLGVPRRRTELVALRDNSRGAIVARDSGMPCILTEPFFGSSPSDWARMKDAHEELAEAYMDGIEAYAKARGIAPGPRLAAVAGAMGHVPLAPVREVTPDAI